MGDIHSIGRAWRIGALLFLMPLHALVTWVLKTANAVSQVRETVLFGWDEWLANGCILSGTPRVIAGRACLQKCAHDWMSQIEEKWLTWRSH